MKRACFFILSLLALCVPGKAQSIAETFSLANTHIENKEYGLARYHLERIIYFSEADTTTLRAYTLAKETYIAEHNWRAAIRTIDLCYPLMQDELDRDRVSLEKATILLSLQSYDDALDDILSVEPETSPELWELRTACLASCYYGLGQFDSSRIYFMQLLPADTAQVNALFMKVRKAGRLNPSVAQWMSVFVPGLGQFYAGDVRNGLNSFLLNGGLIVAAIYLSQAWTFIDALVLVAPWFMRYYQGGIQRAPLSVEKAIRKKRARYYGELMKLLETQSARK